MRQEPSGNKAIDLIITIIFLSALTMPLFIWIARNDKPFSYQEKRPLQKLPAWTSTQSFTQFTKRFDSYFADHFGFREWLIHRYQREISKRFHSSSLAAVIKGNQGWLFFTGDRLLEDARAHLRLPEKQERQFWMIFQEKTNWLREKKIAYFLMIAANKQSIYPEHLPPVYQCGIGKMSRLDHLLQLQAGNMPPNFVDTRSVLRNKKRVVRLYDKSDTHWNFLGALYSYRYLMQSVGQVFPEIHFNTSFSFQKNWHYEPGGDLALMLGKRQETPEQRPVIDSSRFTSHRIPLPGPIANILTLPQLKPSYTLNQSGSLRILVLHDSFFELIKPFSSETFREALYLRLYSSDQTKVFFNKSLFSQLVDSYHPDLVIEEMVERSLASYLQANWYFLPL